MAKKIKDREALLNVFDGFNATQTLRWNFKDFED